MGRAEREKGRKGEAEVAAIYRQAGLEVRGLEAGGDHLIVCGPAAGVVIHSESKRQETARPWAWYEQAATDVPPGALAVVNFRRNRSPWLALLEAAELAGLLGRLESTAAALERTRRHVLELENELEAANDRPIV